VCIYIYIYIYIYKYIHLLVRAHCTSTSSWHGFKRVYPWFHREHFNRDGTIGKIVYAAEFSWDNGSTCHGNGLHANVSRKNRASRPGSSQFESKSRFIEHWWLLEYARQKSPSFFFLFSMLAGCSTEFRTAPLPRANEQAGMINLLLQLWNPSSAGILT